MFVSKRKHEQQINNLVVLLEAARQDREDLKYKLEMEINHHNITIDRIGVANNRIKNYQAQLRELRSRRMNLNGGTSISEKEIRRLLMLCHPDKHSNSKASNDMTAALLKMRQA